jgi:hypothetical protein
MYHYHPLVALCVKAQAAKTMSNDGQVKSFVDKLIKACGTVVMRVASVLQSAEVLPLLLLLLLLSNSHPFVYTPCLTWLSAEPPS